MDYETDSSPDLAQKYQESPATSAPRGNLPEIPTISADANANPEYEPLSCPSAPETSNNFPALNPLPQN